MMQLNNDSHISPPRRTLDYARPALWAFHSGYATLIGIVAIIAGIIFAWCAVHTGLVMVELQRVTRSQAIDFNPANLGMPLERAIPLGVFSFGVALVAMIKFIRMITGRARSTDY